MDFTAVKGKDDTTVNVTNNTDGLCAVRITKMSDGTTQYQSSISLGTPSNETTAFTFKIEASANYMIEAWYYNSSTQKLIPTAVKYA